MLKRGEVFLAILLIFILAPGVHAFGLGIPYLENNTLKLAPGQSYDYAINVQNGDDASFNVSIDYASELIIKLREYTKFIPAKSYDNKFILEITVPSDAEIGRIYNVEYKARPIADREGQIPLTVELNRGFQIRIVNPNESEVRTENKETDPPDTKPIQIPEQAYYILIAIVILALTIILAIKLWKISKSMLATLAHRSKPHALSEAESIVELIKLIKMLRQSEYEISDVRKIIAKRFNELNDKNAADIILQNKNKSHTIKLLSRK